MLKLDHKSVSSLLHLGGTFLGSSRCEGFMTEEGRRIAAQNIQNKGAHALVVIGGDGSLKGLRVFRSEWDDHIEALGMTKRRLAVIGVGGTYFWHAQSKQTLTLLQAPSTTTSGWASPSARTRRCSTLWSWSQTSSRRPRATSGAFSSRQWAGPAAGSR